MRHPVVLFIHFLATLVRLLGPGGVRSIVAESLLLKHQLLIVNRSRQRSPNLCTWDRILAGGMALLMPPTCLLRSAIVLKPSTLLAFHKAMSKRKYRNLFSPNRLRKPGPKGPSAELIHAIVEMKQRNPNWGCPRIAQHIALSFKVAASVALNSFEQFLGCSKVAPRSPSTWGFREARATLLQPRTPGIQMF